MKIKNITQFQKNIDYQFKNVQTLKTALTHRSTLNEANVKESYERLEFLGDAVLELMISSYLFKTFSQKNEGYLTSARSAIVRTQSLAQLAGIINLDRYIYMSKGEEAGDGRSNQSTLEDAVESLIGAIYIDGGLKAVQKFFDKFIVPHAQKILKKNQLKDSKSQLQERVQSKGLLSPIYKTIATKGPDHDKTFTVAVLIKNKQISAGNGKNKQEAEQKAAQKALKLV